MGFVRMALGKALAYSAVLGVDETLRPKWSAALAKMAPFRTTMVGGVEVFAQSASVRAGLEHPLTHAASVATAESEHTPYLAAT